MAALSPCIFKLIIPTCTQYFLKPEVYFLFGPFGRSIHLCYNHAFMNEGSSFQVCLRSIQFKLVYAQEANTIPTKLIPINRNAIQILDFFTELKGLRDCRGQSSHPSDHICVILGNIH